MSDKDDDDDEIYGPERCYFCGRPRDDYFGMLCERCRKEAQEREDANGRDD